MEKEITETSDIQNSCWVLYLDFFFFQVSDLELNDFSA